MVLKFVTLTQEQVYAWSPGWTVGRMDFICDEGVPWWDAPIPSEDHKCGAHTYLSFDDDPRHPFFMDRCTCGASRVMTFQGEVTEWENVNSRRSP